jgi:hypothetical protein
MTGGRVFNEQRRAPRRVTGWRATSRAPSGIIVGEILDISAHGAFFAPADDGTGLSLARQFSLDQKIALQFSEEALVGLELPAKIRWIGYSPTHRRVGFGVEFSHLPLG